MDPATLHRRTVEEWQRRLDAVSDSDWTRPTPCTDWDVRALANHVVGEELWTRPLLEGRTIAEVGDRFDGDVLGDDPAGTGRASSADASAAVEELLPGIDQVHLSYGDERAEEYVRQLSADHLIHGWDLAVATGQDRTLDPELVADVATWFAEREELYRSAGVTGPRADGAGGDPQSDLLLAFGRSPDWT
jgi:uncharacterized protein (TIGR03086 family)